MQSIETSFLCAMIAGLLDVAANLASTKSNGFARRGWGVISILLVVAAFTFLGQAVKAMDLAVAYAVLGATGILGTALCGRIFFHQRLKPIAWLGFALVIGAVCILHHG